MKRSAWLLAAAFVWLTASGLPADAQQPATPTAPLQAQPVRPAQPAPVQPAPARPAPSAPKAKRPPQAAPQKAKPNRSYSFCRSVARRMRLRGAERRRTITDCQLGILPPAFKG